MQYHAALRNITQRHTILAMLRNNTQRHTISRNATQYHAAPLTISRHATPRKTPQYHAAPHNIRQCYAISRSTTQYSQCYAISRSATQYSQRCAISRSATQYSQCYAISHSATDNITPCHVKLRNIHDATLSHPTPRNITLRHATPEQGMGYLSITLKLIDLGIKHSIA